MTVHLPLGKIPPELLARLIAQAGQPDPRLVLGPGIGLDCAILDIGDRCLALKSDPITFATDQIGWYAVQINANDIATCGAIPRWFLITMLLPEGKASQEEVLKISRQVGEACQTLGINLIGGHTEVTAGLDRPILAGTMIGEVPHEKLITPKGASPGDHVLLTKSVPIEATAILAREKADFLKNILSDDELRQAQDYLRHPGISVVRDAAIAIEAGRVTAMHDPTEGGLATALWEVSDACGYALVVNPSKVPITPLSARICLAFGLDPLAAIASGALLLTVPSEETRSISSALERAGIPCTIIGRVDEGDPIVLQEGQTGLEPLPRPRRDEIARILEGEH